MPGIRKVEAGHGKAGAGHAAAGAGYARQEFDGAANARKVEKKVKQSNRQYGPGGIQQLFLIFFQMLQNFVHDHTRAGHLAVLL